MRGKGLFVVGGLALLAVLMLWWGTREREAGARPRPALEARQPAAGGDELREGASQLADERRDAAPGASGTSAEAPAAAGQGPPAPTHRIAGRVVDERRRAVEGARVTLGGTQRAAEAGSGGTSGRDGRFELLLVRDEGAPYGSDCVVARDGAGRAAVRALGLPPPADELLEVDAGTLVLLPAHSLRVHVRRGGAAAPGASVELALGHRRLVAGLHPADAEGTVVLEALPAGPVHLRAQIEGHEGRTAVFVPESVETTVELELLGGIDVLVVDAHSGAGVAGAELEITERYRVPAALPDEAPGQGPHVAGEYVTSRARPGPAPITDGEGRARVEGLAPGARYALEVRASGYQPFPTRPASGARLAAGGEPVRVELTPFEHRRVRWPVVAGEVAVPSDGAEVRLRHQPGSYLRGTEPPLPGPGRMEGSTLVVEDVAGRASFLATAPDGAIARLWADASGELGRETSFRRPRRIEVRVRDVEGAPVTGARVGARNQGNNELCEPVSTGAEGRALLEGLHGGLAEVSVLAPGESGRFGRTVGTVDLEQGDASLEVELTEPRLARARLHVRVDGAPGLPALFSVRGDPRVEVVEELPERGELLLEVHLGAETAASVWMQAAGFAPASASLAFGAGGAEPSAHVELERATVLVARVSRPAEDYVQLTPQRFDEEQGGWKAGPGMIQHDRLSYPNGPGGRFLFAGATPGRWRVLDQRSELASSEVTVHAGDREAEVELDLASLEWASGRVETDDPAELERARVLVEHPGAAPAAEWRPGLEPPAGAWIQGGGFRVRVPGDREVLLVAWHPWLVPDPMHGRARLHGGRDDVVLRLVPGDGLRLPAPQLEGRAGVRVARYPAQAAELGAPLAWHHAVLDEGVVRCALPAGRWTLFVEPGDGFAPLVLRDVVIAGATLLPEARFSAGSSLRVRVLAPEGSDPPRIYVYAERVGEPVYHRSINSRGEAEVRLAGLGPGRWRVRMSVVMGRRVAPEQEVTVDGVQDAELELDLR